PFVDGHGRFGRVQVGGGEQLPQVLGGDFGTGGVGVVLDVAGEDELQPAGEGEAVLGLQQVGDAARAGLAVHPDHGVVVASDIGRVDGQVRHVPRCFGLGEPGRGRRGAVVGETLVDGVLVGAGEGGVDQVADVGVAFVYGDAVAVLDR